MNFDDHNEIDNYKTVEKSKKTQRNITTHHPFIMAFYSYKITQEVNISITTYIEKLPQCNEKLETRRSGNLRILGP